MPRSRRGGSEYAVIQHARVKPAPNGPTQVREGLQLAHELRLVDAVEAFRDIGIQAVLGVLVDRGEDRSDGIVDRASRTKALTVGRKLRFPLRL